MYHFYFHFANLICGKAAVDGYFISPRYKVFDRKIILHTMDADIEYYGKMKELEEKAGEEFYRTHRSFLVNFGFVRKYDAATVWLEKGQALIAKQNYGGFVKAYLRYNQRKGRR